MTAFMVASRSEVQSVFRRFGPPMGAVNRGWPSIIADKRLCKTPVMQRMHS